MKLSLIVCTRNRADQLMALLPSYQALIPVDDYEILWIDNASSDHTPEVLQQLSQQIAQSHVLSCPQIGLGAARQFAAEQATGDLLIFTDDDCYPAADFLSAYQKLFEQNDWAYASGRIVLWDDTDAKVTVDYRNEPVIHPAYQFIYAGAVQGANFAVRKSALEKVGNFDARLGAGTPFPCEDIELVGRLSFSGYQGGFDPSPLIYHHHGRKPADIPKLIRGYDQGRGAYYMKMFLFAPARWKTLKFVAKTTLKQLIKEPKKTPSIGREIRAAWQFFWASRRQKA